MKDWAAWHRGYDLPGSRLAQRLEAVRDQVGAALDRAAPGSIDLLSLCAGDGRDVLPVLRAHPRGPDVRARLVELDPRLCAAARAAAPSGVEVVQGDAAFPAPFAPVDVLLLCGIFGNVGGDDVARACHAIPALLRPGGTVIWTRHTRPPDLTPQVRAWCADSGIDESAFVRGAEGWSVGAGVRTGPASSIPPTPLFTFRR